MLITSNSEIPGKEWYYSWKEMTFRLLRLSTAFLPFQTIQQNETNWTISMQLLMKTETNEKNKFNAWTIVESSQMFVHFNNKMNQMNGKNVAKTG